MQRVGKVKIKSIVCATLDNFRLSKISYATFLPVVGALLFCVLCALTGCAVSDSDAAESSDEKSSRLEVNDISFESEKDFVATQKIQEVAEEDIPQADDENKKESPQDAQDPDTLRDALNISEDYRSCFVHGDKDAQYQKYIVLHDTENDNDANTVVSYWDENGTGIAAHFVVDKDGSIVQCVPLDKIAHHVGYGNAGYDDDYGVTEDGRDDMVGSTPIGSSYPDYGMNAYSIGIELVHVGGSGDYPEAQLVALDDLIAYIDAYYREQGYDNGGKIIDHKMWRTTNSDTSSEFAGYLDSYINTRRHG